MELTIIFAMDEELRAFLNLFPTYETSSFKGRTLYTVSHSNHTVTALKSGIGKTHAAYVATLILDREKPDALLNVGVAGGLNVTLGTLVVGTTCAYHDVDVTPFGYPYGQMAGAPHGFHADETLLDAMRASLEDAPFPHAEGTILTGDQFVQSRQKVERALEIHPDALVVDMEAAAIAHVARLESVPFLSVRTVSDELDTDIQMDTYELEMEKSATQAAKTVKAMIGQL
ncbi:MAG: 5'-methylthioadenosine/adenosylhomocysteine nucleosidase [Bacillota bacterium]